MGVDPTEAKVLMANDPWFSEIAGAHSRDTDTVYVNDAAHDNASKAVNTVGHETQHYLDNQQTPDAEQTKQYKANREEYAVIMGDATADYLGFNFAQNDTSLADGNSHSFGSNLEEAKRNLDLVSDNNTAYSNESPDALDSRYLHPEERELADKLAQESDGQFTAEEMRDALRHALPADAKEYPQGLSDYVLDTAQATDETLQYMDGSEGRLIVTQDENGDARYVVQDIGSIPLNDDAKAYIQEQDLGYSFVEPTERTDSGYQEEYWDRGAGSLAMATGLQFNLDTVDARTIDEIDRDLEKLNFGMANLVALPISGSASVAAYGVKSTLGYMGVAATFDAAGQLVQGGEYRPGQTVLAAQTALTLGPLLSSSVKGNALVGSLAGGSNVATNNFYYDENKSVGQGTLFGAAGAGGGTYFGDLVSKKLKDMPSSVVIPYFQTPATITVTLPSAGCSGQEKLATGL